MAWRDDGKYYEAHHQCLEEVLNPAEIVTPDGKMAEGEALFETLVLDLYLPIAS